MIITINGKEVDLEKEVTMTQLLEDQNVKMKDYVTVQVNDEIINRVDFEETVIKEKDVIEFIYFMGGGQYGAK